MGLGGCCTFHVQLSGTMEGKNVSSARSPPHPASLPLTGIAGTQFSEDSASLWRRETLLMPAQTALMATHVCLQIHHYSFMTLFIHLFIPQTFPEHIHTMGQPRLWARNGDQCLAFDKLPICWERQRGNRPALSAVVEACAPGSTNPEEERPPTVTLLVPGSYDGK